MNPFLRAALAAVLVLVTSTAFAATRYVTDELRVGVRTGAGTQYRIIEVLDSGMQVETLQSEGDWSQVRTPQGNTGWMPTQYLVEQPVAADRLRSARAELESARERIAELEEELAQARSEAESARERVESLSTEKKRLEARLADAQRGLELHDENERLKNNIKSLVRREKEFRQEIEQLQERERKEWFVIGAGVLLGGMLFGIIVTRIPWRGRRDRMF